MTDFLRLLAITCLLLVSRGVSAEDKFFDSNGVRIHFIEAGKGEPVVLVHGRGDTTQNWIDNGVFANLAKDYHVIAIDCRGHGKSGKPREPRLYGKEMGLDVVRLLDHLGIRRAHIVRYSMGAMITSQLLTTHADRFWTATLGGAVARFDWTATDAEFFEKGAAETEQLGFSPTTRQATAPPGSPKLTEEQIKNESTARLADPSQDRFAIAALMRSFGDQVVLPAKLAAAKLPVFGVVGADDPKLAEFKTLKQFRPELRFVVIDGATHSGARDTRKRPEFIAAIREFLAENRQRSGR